MGENVECVDPNCDEVFDPDQTGGVCPKDGTPHPSATSPIEDPAEPEVPCPDPDCSGTIPEGANYCPTCRAERGTDFPPNGGEGGEGGPQTCPNGHEVDPDVDYCPNCGEPVSAGGASGGGAQGPSVTLQIGSQAYDVIEDGEITVDDDQKSRDVFGTDARRAAQAEGVDASTAKKIHRDYLSFRVDGDDCYVTNEGQNPTKYNGDDFSQGEERHLNDGDKIELGAGAVTAFVDLEN